MPPGAGPRGSGSPTRRRTSSASAGTWTRSSTSRPDADPRMPSASKPGRRRIPGSPRSTSHEPDLERVRALEPGRHEGVAQVRAARWSRSSRRSAATSHPPRRRRRCPGSRHGPASHRPPRSRRCSRSAPRWTIARVHPVAERVRHADRVDQRPDDVDLHREPERRRTIDGTRGPSGPPRPPPSAAPSPPASAGTTSRWSPLATIASAARGSKASPRSSAASRSMVAASAWSVATAIRGHDPPRAARIGPTSMPARESAMSAASRRSRVAACLALVIQCVTVRRYDGDRRCQSAQACDRPGSARSRRRSGPSRPVS